MFQRRIGNRIGLIDDAISVFKDVTGFLKDLGDKFVIGDQVPQYPIKSKNTLAGILADIARAYPNPTSVAMAKEQLARAQFQSEEAYAKGGSVNTTYGMIFDELIQVLKNYISYDGQLPGATNTPGVTPNPNPSPTTTSNKMLMGGLLLGGVILLTVGKPTKRRSNRR
jgi:hypothetical protein